MVSDVRRTSEQRSRPDVFYKCERGTQTNVIETRDDAVDCKSIQRSTFSGQVDQAIICDAYDQQKEKRPLTSESKVKESTFQMNSRAQPEYVKNLVYNLRVLERMVCQNQIDDILMDYVVWNDPADEYRQHGSLYPLWRIKHTEVRARHLPVSCIEWSNAYMDLLYIGYGSLCISRNSEFRKCDHPASSLSLSHLSTGVCTGGEIAQVVRARIYRPEGPWFEPDIRHSTSPV
ncbi:hypothetical protein T265_02270 [Opisthorchis viverrini]|uniref:Uncharacterized protein n=1 Tax=Opisthorchis viverrini TaxID=6198 RepID=A0A075A757_OPIVI|nr:hypothetical protein T265_02270 [Opisthorchis viverrini]KER31500.1 hypothetical protein T265_02270 [Opisthorchis viverrini]